MTQSNVKIKIYFTDFFGVNKSVLENYGAFNISLINDLPLFIDPFLLFDSENSQYKSLHESMIKYIGFLKHKIQIKNGNFSNNEIKAWFLFQEVKQNWLGYSRVGNSGRGLNRTFANTLIDSFTNNLSDFENNDITQGLHPEKLCLIKDGTGKDSVSDLTVNLIKKFLLEYTQTFAKKYISRDKLKEFRVEKVEFNYYTESWQAREYILPKFEEEYVLLTPKNILTKDESWINKKEMIGDFSNICSSISNVELRAKLEKYFNDILPANYNAKDWEKAVKQTIEKFPEFIDYFIKIKEIDGKKAHIRSDLKIRETQEIFIGLVSNLVEALYHHTNFYQLSYETLKDTYQRIIFLKNIIENKDEVKLSYQNKLIKKESDLQILFRLIWFVRPFYVDNDIKIDLNPLGYENPQSSKGKMLVEFKLANNKKLKQSLKNQIKKYGKENLKSIKVIIYSSFSEYDKVNRILRELNLKVGKNIVLINAIPE